MSNNIGNLVSFLRTSWDFPTDPKELNVQLNRSYIEIANSVNTRTVGIFPENRPVITGEQFYLAGNRKQQTFRQVYQFVGPSPITIPHGITFGNIFGFSRIYGTFTDGSIWYPLPYVDVASATNQVNVIVNSTDIVITAGAGTPPTISSGIIVLEWLSQP